MVGVLDLGPGYPTLEPERTALLVQGGFLYSFSSELFMSHERMKVITEESAKDLPFERVRNFVESGNGRATVGVLSRYAWEVDVADVLKQVPWEDEKKRERLVRTARAELDQVHKMEVVRS